MKGGRSAVNFRALPNEGRGLFRISLQCCMGASERRTCPGNVRRGWGAGCGANRECRRRSLVSLISRWSERSCHAESDGARRRKRQELRVHPRSSSPLGSAEAITRYRQVNWPSSAKEKCTSTRRARLPQLSIATNELPLHQTLQTTLQHLIRSRLTSFASLKSLAVFLG